MSMLSATRNRQWIGCVDFGTAFSKVVLVRRKLREDLIESDIVLLPIGRASNGRTRQPFMLPSVVYVGEAGIMFGDHAQNSAIRAERLGRRPFSSPKQYLSTIDSDDLDEKLESDIDPTQQYTARMLLILFLAHLLDQTRRAAKDARTPWPVPIRIARPAWRGPRAEIGERTLRALILRAFTIADKLSDKLSNEDGISHDVARQALELVMHDAKYDDARRFRGVFEFSPQTRNASVLEATAVAAGSIRRPGRRVVVVADIGAGTSDFGAFMTGFLRESDDVVIGEIEGSEQVLTEAGDHLDMLLTRYILDETGIDPHDPAGKGAARRLRIRQRANKEVLFSEGKVTVELNDDIRTITREDFVRDRRVCKFTERLTAKFRETLDVAVKCALEFAQPGGGQTRIEIMLTGGGYALPMVAELAANPPIPWGYIPASPEFPAFRSQLDSETQRRQLAVAVGGAVWDLPKLTATVRLNENAGKRQLSNRRSARSCRS
jgi:molecular chaperone DnaK (HSP70)